jgi:hypothetical protein
MPLYLLTVFAKNERAKLTTAERNDLSELVDLLVETWTTLRRKQPMSTAFEMHQAKPG